LGGYRSPLPENYGKRIFLAHKLFEL